MALGDRGKVGGALISHRCRLCKVTYREGGCTGQLAQCRAVGAGSCWAALVVKIGCKDLDLEQGFDYGMGVVIRGL